MKTRVRLTALSAIVFAAFVLLAAGCDSSLKSTRHFRFPQGDAEKGKAAFVALQCYTCHTLQGAQVPEPTAPPEAVVLLGGDVTRLRTVGDLLTSIVHPKHGISEKMKRTVGTAPESPMPVMNDVMTVAQLIDLVAYLQPQYKQIPPSIDQYPLP
ncbi:MAG TPA: cytochrome c [Opitutaceae bacterium]